MRELPSLVLCLSLAVGCLTSFPGSAAAQEPPPPAPPAAPAEPPPPSPEPPRAPPPPPAQEHTHPRSNVGRFGGSPVEHPNPGDMGFQFNFGGLSSMRVDGPVSHTVGRLFFSEVGLKLVLSEKWMLPISAGVGFISTFPENADSANDVGVSFTIGPQYYFRIWRRIAPYVGAKFHMHYVDPSGPSNFLVQIALGPTLGVEYFIGDLVSLTIEYAALFGVNMQDNPTFTGAGNPSSSITPTVGFQTLVSMGGQMALTFYWH